MVMAMPTPLAPVPTRKRAIHRSPPKKIPCILFLFALGALQFLAVRQNSKSAFQLELSLVRNEFLDKPPTSIVVVGERHSGCAHAAAVLRGAFGADVTRLHERIFRRDVLDRREVQRVAARTDVLWIVVVQSPCDAADALIQSQRDACWEEDWPSARCKLHAFASEADFYRMPWHDIRADSDEDESSLSIIASAPGREIKYGDIFDMRRQQLLLLKQIMEALPRHVKVVRRGDFELNPDAFVNDLVTEYGFQRSKKYAPVPPSIDPQSQLTCMDHEKWKEAQQRIDWTLEGYFGYTANDCHHCRDASQAASNGLPLGAPSKIYILGERNSGTTFVSTALAEAFEPPNAVGSQLEQFSSDVPVLLHKHMFRHDLLNDKELAEIRAREDVLWVMVLRSPCDWAEAMFRKPYHLCPPNKPEKCGPGSDPAVKIWLNQNSVAGTSLLEFFTTTAWGDWAESVPFLRDEGDQVKGTGVVISKAGANYTYPNVFGLRRHKLELMKQILNAVPRNVKFVRLKELERSPEVFIQGLVKQFNMTVKKGYTAQPPSRVAHSTVCLTSDEWDAAQRAIDWKFEAGFGFSPGDCRLCYGYDKSKRLYSRVQEGKKIRNLLKQAARATDTDAKNNNKRGRFRAPAPLKGSNGGHNLEKVE